MASPAPEKKYTMAVKAYKNPDFLNSGHARFIRVMCEYEVRLDSRVGVCESSLFRSLDAVLPFVPSIASA